MKRLFAALCVLGAIAAAQPSPKNAASPTTKPRTAPDAGVRADEELIDNLELLEQLDEVEALDSLLELDDESHSPGQPAPTPR